MNGLMAMTLWCTKMVKTTDPGPPIKSTGAPLHVCGAPANFIGGPINFNTAPLIYWSTDILSFLLCNTFKSYNCNSLSKSFKDVMRETTL